MSLSRVPDRHAFPSVIAVHRPGLPEFHGCGFVFVCSKLGCGPTVGRYLKVTRCSATSVTSKQERAQLLLPLGQ
ncbi:hypothetical protein Q1695_006519 [Nippostrongylus brasiliensis]|nr:hypothetical protein Q1695_006519 [Nippostrongylus brasiliensis]